MAHIRIACMEWFLFWNQGAGIYHQFKLNKVFAIATNSLLLTLIVLTTWFLPTSSSHCNP